MMQDGPISDSRANAWYVWASVAAALVAAAVIYRYYAHIPPMLEPSNFYGLLGEAFLAGQTYLKIPVSPQLLALKDPYDPATNQAYLLWDASLYHGRYYLYFGPVPALLWAGVKYASGISLSDPELVLGFSSAATACLAVLLTSVALHDKIASKTGLACGLLSLALGTGLPFMLRRPSFYEVAVSGAYCFSAFGMLALWRALTGRSQARWRWMTLAGLCFGLAVGCRVSHVFTLIPMGAAWMFLYYRSPRRDALAALLCLLTPWACIMAGLMLYNYVRFDSVFETGVHYQLTFYNARSPAFKLLDTARFIPNVYLYLLRPLAFKTPLSFPFFHVVYYDKIALPFHVTAETMEPVYGLLTNSPFALWIFAAPFCILGQSSPLTRETKALIACLTLYGFTLLAFLLFFFYTTARYTVDFAPWLMMVAALMYLRALSLARRRAAYAVLAAAGVLSASYGVFTNTMSGYCGQYLCEAAK